MGFVTRATTTSNIICVKWHTKLTCCTKFGLWRSLMRSRVYQNPPCRLSEKNELLPFSLATLFDGERLSPTKAQQISRSETLHKKPHMRAVNYTEYAAPSPDYGKHGRLPYCSKRFVKRAQAMDNFSPIILLYLGVFWEQRECFRFCKICDIHKSAVAGIEISDESSTLWPHTCCGSGDMQWASQHFLDSNTSFCMCTTAHLVSRAPTSGF